MANTITVENKLQKEITRHLDKMLVVYPYANNKYEGTLKESGTTVSVQTVPNFTWTTGGTAGAEITATDITMTKETMTISGVAQIRVELTNYEQVKANIDVLSAVAERIAYGQADLLDQSVMAFYADANIPTANKLNAALAVTLAKDTVYGYIEEMAVQLDLQNVPRAGNRALFVSPTAASVIRQSSVFDGTAKGLDARINGFVGYLSGFTILMTNNYATDWTDDFMVAMDKDSIHYVKQLNKMKITDGEKGFYKNLLWEMVHGGKVFEEAGKRIVTSKITK